MALEHQRNCKCLDLPGGIHANAARIPWLPARPTSKTPFCRSAFYKNFIVNASSSHEIIQKKCGALYVWDVAFPIYLAGRYHNMKSTEIQKMSKKTGHYFFNAIHFTQSTMNHGTLPFFKVLKGQMIIDNRLSLLSSIFAKCKPDLCETAAEFLLEPWVIIQLPFQPALLHQWAVAALAETLRFCKRLVEIGTRGYAPQFHDLYTNLAKLSKTLSLNCNSLLLLFFEIQCKEPTETVHVKIYKMRMLHFFELLAEALTILEFVLSDECVNIMDCIKSSSWRGEFSPEDLVVSADLSEIGLSDAELGQMGLLNIYSLSYWTEGHARNEYYLSKQMAKKMNFFAGDSSSVFSSKTDQRAALHMARKILSTLRGFTDVEEFLAGLETNLDIFEILLRETKVYYKWRETSSASARNENGFGAIINDMLGLQSDVLVEKALGKVTRQIWLAAKKFNKDVCLETKESSSEPQLSIQDALNKITSVINCHESWMTLAISRKANATCIYDKNLPVGPNMDTELAAEQISGATRAMMMKFYGNQYRNLPGIVPNVPKGSPFKHNTDCMVLQYIFPCFVATYLELFGKPESNMETKRKYYIFLMDLLVGFEAETHIELLDSCKKQFFHETNIFYSSMAVMCQEISSVLKSAFESESVTYELGDKLIPFLGVGGPPEEKPNEPVAEAFVQLHKFLCRMNMSLLKAGIWEEYQCGDEVIVRELLPLFITFKQKVSISDKIWLTNYLLYIMPSRYTAAFIRLCKFVKNPNDLSAAIRKDSTKLTMPQVFAISLYEAWSNQQMSESQFYSIYQGPLFTLNRELDVASKIVSKDWWGLKKCVIYFVKEKGKLADISLISMEVAKNNLCCKPLLKALTASNKVKMDEPGQVTFFPIKHCRWCGAVYASQFRLCAECKDEPYYPHPNYFCSKKCEKVAMEKFHTEEHARFIMEQLGL